MLVGEAGEIRAINISAYRSDGFTIIAEGESNGALRRIRSEIAHDSFLKYARFVENSGTGYSCRALLTGELYVGGDLGVPTCSAGEEATFLELVAAEGDIPNAAAGIFTRGYVTDAPHVDLQNSVDFDEIRDKAKGLAAQNLYVGYASSLIDDDTSGESSGNDDGVINPGETIELPVQLENFGSQTALAVSATLTTEQADFLENGAVYINLHTERYPGGELRGNLTR